MKFLSILSFLILYTQVVPVSADETAASTYISPCESWRYNSEVGAYVCSYYSFRTRFVEYNDFQRALYQIDDLERKVQELEGRIERLEGLHE